MENNWTYEKLDENYEVKSCPMNDTDGKITGQIIIGLPQWFDENPEERKRLGWIKHIHHEEKDVDYNKQTQYVVCATREIDEYTIEDVYHVLDKSEEMFLFEEMLEVYGLHSDGGFFFY